MGVKKKTTRSSESSFFAQLGQYTQNHFLAYLIFMVWLLMPFLLSLYFFFQSNDSNFLCRVKNVYRGFEGTNGLFLWSTGLTLSILGYYTFITERRRERKRLEEVEAEEREKRRDHARQYFITRLDLTSHSIQAKILEIIISKDGKDCNSVSLKHCLELQHLYFKWTTDLNSLNIEYKDVDDFDNLFFEVSEQLDWIKEDAGDKGLENIRKIGISKFKKRKNLLMQFTVHINRWLLER